MEKREYVIWAYGLKRDGSKSDLEERIGAAESREEAISMASAICQQAEVIIPATLARARAHRENSVLQIEVSLENDLIYYGSVQLKK